MIKEIIIIGGGIGGLSAALLLEKRGFSVRVYEEASSIKGAGAGIGIGSNAIRALDEAGIGETILEIGNVLEKQVFLNGRGRKMTELNFSLIDERFGAKNITIHRGELLRMLQQALPAKSIQLKKRCIDFKQSKDKVEVIFEDGSKDEADFVIAADGIHSFFRRKLVPGSVPRYAGYTCWRGVVANKGRIEQHSAAEMIGRACRFGIVPLKNEQIYWFACINAGQKDPALKGARSKDVARLFQKFPQPAVDLIRETPDDELLHHDILDIRPLKSFTFDRIALLGDAAHATTPNMGQGAGQAIEDAIVLTNAFIKAKTIEQALHFYNEKRVKRTAKIITMSRQIGAAAQAENRFLVKLRDAVFTITPPRLLHKRFQFLYDVDFE
ncbi:FAD-dependent monooxygenase [Halalkalibacter oceani]|uniref:FAD-dependent monooxygenase n=1 Tax=Halalkalibacter oceani TaxID=1653776 RepID=A0A9X2DQA6_9BACI|nr:FAD-dependent monooxygenase [Halalkalibacter oceani]MCM3714422.1 FAD-dependent monooxygenase [Halalkalibacter oceani]